MIDMIIIATIFSLLTTQTTEENPADDSITDVLYLLLLFIAMSCVVVV